MREQHKFGQEEGVKFDVKLFLLACLRISAVIHDIEIKQDEYTRLYYDAVKSEHMQRAELKAQHIISVTKDDRLKNV